MIFYRLVTGRYASETWTGSGANQHGGRWNHQGHPADAPPSAGLAAFPALAREFAQSADR